MMAVVRTFLKIKKVLVGGVDGARQGTPLPQSRTEIQNTRRYISIPHTPTLHRA
jgi:hypothetical protein